MRLGDIARAMVAGAAGTLAHLALMGAKSGLGVMPQFQPYDELQRGLATLTGTTVSAPAAYLLTFVNGALIWGFVFGRIYRRLPGAGALAKGLFFAICAWAISGLAILPLLGKGPFGWGYGMGASPAVLMLVMLCVYSTAMSFAYAALTGPSGLARP